MSMSRPLATTQGGALGRDHGLDTLSALAIALVFAYHYKVFVSAEPTLGWASRVGWVGVDLFFVLSGYLIANQLFAGIRRGRALSLSAFYARRALRTLPVFWLVLAAYFLLPSVMGGRTPPPLWRFLTFTQNFNLQPGTAFSHAWSLCIEEQFYLVLPLVLVLGLRFGRRRAHGWALLVFGAFFWLLDAAPDAQIRQRAAWLFKPLVVYGMNALFIFALSGLVAKLMLFIKLDGGVRSLKQALYAPIQALPLAPQNASLLWALLFNAAMLAVAWWMWSKRWFIKA